MTNKEQIIINGKKQYCKILFRCKHIDDTAAYDMMCEGIEITPENAPVSDYELMLIENTNSPFGFSFVCKRNNKEDVWEHSGFGNSGACSLVTALLKQLACKTQECEELEGFKTLTREAFTFGDSDVDDKHFIKYLQEYTRSYEEAINGCFQLTHITGIDNTVHGGADIEEIVKRVDSLKHECEELKSESFTREELISMQEKDIDRYRKALEEIGDLLFQVTNVDFPKDDYITPAYKDVQTYYRNLQKQILSIINKAKGK